VIEGPIFKAYRGVMTAAAGVAQVASRLPAAPGHWRSLGDRLGRLAPTERAVATAGTVVWLHAASVGELVAVRPLLRRLRERFPERLYVVSTATRTGLALARTMPEAHLALLLPLDAPGPVRRLLRHFRLEAFLFTETEIWPTLLVELADARVPAFMVSGRVSARTATRTRWLRPLYRRALATVTCCMQTEEDAQRIVALGADPRRVQVAGSLKFDGDRDEPPAHVQRLEHALGPARAIVAGSTHPGEDEAVLDAYRRLVAGRPDLVLVLAPRHPDRMRGAASAIEQAGFRCVRYSTLGDERIEPPVVVLLDMMGALAHCYALGVAAFVGGSLVPVGGHNVLEPAAAARPVLVGPHTEHAADVVERLVAGGGALRVSSAESLAWALAGLLDAPERAADMGRRARALVESGQGAVERHLKIITARLTQTRFARAGDEGDDSAVGAGEGY
jgi:3-deoxy-D-manno-octulosonic-acid transferase